MKKFKFFAVAALMFAACQDKEDLTPQVLTEPVVENVIADTLLQSNVISLEEARKNLENILKNFSPLSKRGGISSREISDGFTLKSDNPSISKSAGGNSDVKIHVFNFDGNAGFAIMSATRDLPSLLAITESGNIDTNNVVDNPGLVTFLSALEGKIKDPDYPMPDPEDEDLIEYQYNTTYSRYNPVGGFCLVKWGQDFPYNLFCYTSSGKQAVTGCVATACAQLMSIYQFPKEYDGWQFDWSKMISGGDYISTAFLMSSLGQNGNLNMEYGEYASGALPSYIMRTLINFGYYGGKMKFATYDPDEVCSELKQGFPVLVGGFTDSIPDSENQNKVFGLSVDAASSYHYEGGHRWLLHGLFVEHRTTKTIKAHRVIDEKTEDVNYVLCNFGWDGDCDGYYWCKAFDTGRKFFDDNFISKKYWFRYNITAVTGIRKDANSKPLWPDSPYNPYD